MTERKLVTTYLEMTSPDVLRASYCDDPAIHVMESQVPLTSFYRYLYQIVGKQWRWVDRNEWPNEQLEAWLAQPSTNIYVLYVAGTPAGFLELDRQPEGTEIAYFGLIERFFHRGYGIHLLSFGVQRAWDLGAKRVWVHTCNLDGPYALHTYQKVGFTICDVKEEPLPDKYKTQYIKPVQID